MQLGGSIYGNLLAGSNLRHPLKIPSGYSSAFLDSLLLNILPQLSTSNSMSSAERHGGELTTNAHKWSLIQTGKTG